MIIKNPPKLINRETFMKYIEVDLWGWLRNLATSVFNINFQENFQAFIVSDLEILAGQEISIANQFKKVYPGKIPAHRIITRQQGDANIIDGIQKWTSEHVYLLNPSANTVKITVIFFN